MEKIEFIIPCYNCESFIRDLEDLKDQIFPPNTKTKPDKPAKGLEPEIKIKKMKVLPVKPMPKIKQKRFINIFDFLYLSYCVNMTLAYMS